MKIKKRHIGLVKAGIIILCFPLSILTTSGQSQMRIKMRSGTVLKGNIFQSMDSTGVRLLINEQSAFFPYDYIKSIQIEGQQVPDTIPTPSYSQFEKGYYHTGGVGLLFGNYVPGISLTMVNGYRFNQFLNTGIGVSYDDYDDISTVPVFLELKGYLKKGRFVPYYFLRPGYGFIVEKTLESYYTNVKNQGGLAWQMGIGYQLNFQETSMAFSLAHMGQNATVSYSYPEWGWGWGWQNDGSTTDIIEKRMKRRVAFRIEFVF